MFVFTKEVRSLSRSSTCLTALFVTPTSDDSHLYPRWYDGMEKLKLPVNNSLTGISIGLEYPIILLVFVKSIINWFLNYFLKEFFLGTVVFENRIVNVAFIVRFNGDLAVSPIILSFYIHSFPWFVSSVSFIGNIDLELYFLEEYKPILISSSSCRSELSICIYLCNILI